MFKTYTYFQILYFLIIGSLLSSCGFTNRMTSPVVLEKSQRIWTYGIAFEPTAKINYDEISWGFQPVIGYRSGIGYNQEIGISLYGIWYPGLVFDHKFTC